MPRLFNKLRTISHKYLLFFLVNIFINCNLLLCETSMIYSSKTSSIETIFSVDTKIGVNTKVVLIKETGISTGSVSNSVKSKPIRGLGVETIIGIIAASITVGIALLFLCKSNKNTNNKSRV